MRPPYEQFPDHVYTNIRPVIEPNRTTNLEVDLNLHKTHQISAGADITLSHKNAEHGRWVDFRLNDNGNTVTLNGFVVMVDGTAYTTASGDRWHWIGGFNLNGVFYYSSKRIT